MSVYKRGKVWWMKYSVAGRVVQESTGTTSKTLAKEIEREKRVSISRGDLIDPTKILFSVFVEEFLTYCKVNKAPQTYRTYKSTLVRLSNQRWGKYFLTSITPKMINDYIIECREEGKALKTINVNLGKIKSLFTYARKLGYLSKSPASEVTALKLPQSERRFFSGKEAKEVLEGCKSSGCEDLWTMVMVGIHTGARLSEILYLKWEDVDFSTGVVNIVSREEHHTKSHKSRVVPMSKEIQRVLKAHHKQVNSFYVFARPNGLPRRPTNITRAFTIVVKKLDMPHATFHTTRHTFCSWGVMAGVDLPTMAKLAGHSSITTTMLYAHLSPEHLKNAVRFLDEQEILHKGTNMGTNAP
jgi:integrase